MSFHVIGIPDRWLSPQDLGLIIQYTTHIVFMVLKWIMCMNHVKGCNPWGERESDWPAKLRSPEAGACCFWPRHAKAVHPRPLAACSLVSSMGLQHWPHFIHCETLADCCHAVASVLAATAAMAATLWAHQLTWPLVGSEVDPSSGPSADLSCRASQKAAAQTQAKLHGLNSTSTFRNEVAQCQDDSAIGRTMFGWSFPDDWKPPRLNKDPSTMLKSTNEMGVAWSHHHYVGVCYRQVLLMFLLTTTPKMFLHREPVRGWNQQKRSKIYLNLRFAWTPPTYCTHLLRTVIANSDVECILRAKKQSSYTWQDWLEEHTRVE